MNNNFDPQTGQPINNVQQPVQANYDPYTGQPINNVQQPVQANYNPYTGQPINNIQQPVQANYDPYTGQPIKGNNINNYQAKQANIPENVNIERLKKSVKFMLPLSIVTVVLALFGVMLGIIPQIYIFATAFTGIKYLKGKDKKKAKTALTLTIVGDIIVLLLVLGNFLMQ